MNQTLLQSWLEALRHPDFKRCEAFQEKDAYCPLGMLAKLNGFVMEPYKPSVVLGKAMLAEYAGKVTDSYRWPKTLDNWPPVAVALRIVDMNSEKDRKKYVYTIQQIADYIEKELKL